MKNIITILIILVLPVMTYLILEKRSSLATTSTTEKKLPTLMIFKNGEAVERLVGLMPKSSIITNIEKHV